MPARYTIASIPHPVKVLGLLAQPAEPFVMVNMLVYKDQATDKFAHLTGREAYSIYAESAMRAQSTMGSRLIWTGEVTEQLAGKALPDFGTVALLEYARPTRLFRFMAATQVAVFTHELVEAAGIENVSIPMKSSTYGRIRCLESASGTFASCREPVGVTL